MKAPPKAVAVRSVTAAVLLAGAVVFALGEVVSVSADEGMWLFNAPPRELLREKYHFDLTDDWLEHARLAAVRFNSGGSGGFVSADGLIITNHHVGADCLQKLSPKDKNYYRDGFLADGRAGELKCPDLELNVLQSVEDVTARVTDAVKADLPPAQAAAAARRAVLASVEKESLEKTGLRSDVVTLYQGGQYHLYRYKKYTDVRLVFAPEHAVASFGGDVDNFEYPRYCLDVCFFRAYENGEPVRPKHFLRWSPVGPADGDVVFVVGNPGTTNRQETLARLKHRRDVTLPYLLTRLRAKEALLEQFGRRGPDELKMADHDLPHVSNSRKAFTGMHRGLLDPTVLARKAEQETDFRARVAADPKLTEAGDAWDRVAKAVVALNGFEREFMLLERGDGLDSVLFSFARHLVRLADEKAKPGPERLREYRDSNLESLEFQLFSPAPVFPELERVKLAGALAFLAEQLGGEHPLTLKLLAGKSAEARATELTAGTRLADPAVRRALAKGGKAALDGSSDAMIEFARLIDPESRALRTRYEDEVEEPERQAYAKLARARFGLYGARVAPDATFTLRLAFGTVGGYEEEGKQIPFRTTLAGLFERSDRQGDRGVFALPARWREAKPKLDLSTPMDFVSTADTIGGNSGSPVLNRAGELVGINFDRNRHGLVRNFVYTDVQARHIAVHSAGVLEALRKVYAADALVKELTAAP